MKKYHFILHNLMVAFQLMVFKNVGCKNKILDGLAYKALEQKTKQSDFFLCDK